VAEAKLVTEAEEGAPAGEELPTEIPPVPEEVLVSAESEAAEPLPAVDTPFIPPEVEPQAVADRPQLRFAEDILAPRPAKPGVKPRKKKKKSTYEKEGTVDGLKLRKRRHDAEIPEEEED